MVIVSCLLQKVRIWKERNILSLIKLLAKEDENYPDQTRAVLFT
jgi:hypothetical protein